MVCQRTLKWALSVASLSFGPSAYAEGGYEACTDNAMSNRDMAECAIAWNKRIEALLAKARRADLSCSFYYGDDFGSMHRSIHAPQCRNVIIEDRARQLSTIAKN